MEYINMVNNLNRKTFTFKSDSQIFSANFVLAFKICHLTLCILIRNME